MKSRVVDEGFVRIERLADELGVTPMTIRRDLDYLEGRGGWKVRGGATAQPSTAFHGDIRHAPSPWRRRRAHSPVPHLASSTRAVPHRRRQHHRSPGIELISLGGAYYPAYDAFLGIRTIDAVNSCAPTRCSPRRPPSPAATATTSPRRRWE
ncbi:DeoR family transcriptional regulator [Streptomyces sp. NPDC050619]|uniref:DeoR family transcriptional regulator n=1 Tax=Streptomyces sp. NPDC050619 TaxID=3157214 RepID=UPI00341F94BE